MGLADQARTLDIVEVRAEALGVLVFALQGADGQPLPGIEPGAHLEIELDNGLIRHYSLTNGGEERNRYVVAVGLSEKSAGGSSFLHERVRRGGRLKVRAVRNNFPLDPSAGRYLFIAGGIGITPILSMVRWCEASGRPWRLAYAVRSAQRAAFYETLRRYGDRVRFHFDDVAGKVLDTGDLLAGLAADEQVYCCGPGPLMAAVKEAGAHLDPGALHFEYFNAPALSEAEAEAAAAARAADGAFHVTLKSDGRRFEVPADKSVLEVLEENGLAIPFSCREGMCRTCETNVCAGEVEHRDYVLSEDERKSGHTMMLCVSRARSADLVLDL